MAGLVLDTPSRHVYTGDGTTRVFPIPTHIQGDDWIRIEIDGIQQIDRRQWDIVNNSIIFVTAPTNGSTLDILVASSIEAMNQFGSVSAIDIVAQNITNVNNVGSNIDDVRLVANNLTTIGESFAEVSTVATNINDVKTVATNINNVNTVANNNNNINTVVTNIVDIQNAEENALISKTSVYKSEAERLTSKSYATEPIGVFAKQYTSLGGGLFTVTNDTKYSSLHYANKSEVASIASQTSATDAKASENISKSKAQEAVVSASNAQASAIIAGAYANMDWAGFSVSDGDLIVVYADGLTSLPSLVDGDFIITY